MCKLQPDLLAICLRTEPFLEVMAAGNCIRLAMQGFKPICTPSGNSHRNECMEH